ncbi:putative methyltransferase-domain-containing protein [Russula ochroleuca]|uniref:Methyltransferase-domain-containing protein n=1 Tax=Russula ochroleuca TaxID=152965 RepID=A0A9P5MZ19_9AGAM|nr:putative methyltransferase-domain-containing protein [Russula ochroleuca]
MPPDPALFNLLQAYSALKHPRFLSFPSHLPFLQVHDFVLSCILLDPHLLQYPPSHAYQLSFWKWAIEHLEKLLGDEACTSLPFISVTISKPATHDAAAPPPPSFVTHYWRPAPQSGPPGAIPSTENHSVTLFESRTTIESGTTGLRTWRASFVLAQFLIQNSTVLMNKSVLELGSGTGFLGLIVADIQVSSGGVTGHPVLYLTDVNEDVLRRCHENTQLPCNASHCHGNLSVKSLDWFDALAQDGVPSIEATLNNMKPELVLGADILYHPDMIAPFLATLNIALRASKFPAGGTAYLALTVRSADLLNSFLLALRGSTSFAYACWQINRLTILILSGPQLVSRRTATLQS